MSTKNLLGLRKQISARRPKFIMQDHHKRAETQARWRRPKGLHSKMRHGVWGRPACVNVGYRGPAETRGLHASGLEQVTVNSTEELSRIDPKKQGVIIGHIGDRKKTQLLNICKQKNIKILNVKDIDNALKAIADKLASRKESKKLSAKQKAEKTAAKAPKKEEKKEEATKEQERKEMEKVLTKREG